MPVVQSLLNKQAIILAGIYSRNYWGHQNPWFQGDPGYCSFVCFSGNLARGHTVETRVINTNKSQFNQDYKVWIGSLYDLLSQSDYNLISSKSNTPEHVYGVNSVRWDDKTWIGTGYGKTVVNLRLNYYTNCLRSCDSIYFEETGDGIFITEFNYPNISDIYYEHVSSKFGNPAATDLTDGEINEPVKCYYNDSDTYGTFFFNNYYAAVPSIEETTSLSPDVSRLDLTSNFKFATYNHSNVNNGFPGAIPLTKGTCYRLKPGWSEAWPENTFNIVGDNTFIYTEEISLYNFWFKVNKRVYPKPKNLKSDNYGTYTWDAVPHAEGAFKFQNNSIGKKYSITYWKDGDPVTAWKTVQTDQTSWKMPASYFYVNHHISVHANNGHKIYLNNKTFNSNAPADEIYYDFYAYVYDENSISSLQETGHIDDIENENIIVDINKAKLTFYYPSNKFPGQEINFVIRLYKNYDISTQVVQFTIGDVREYLFDNLPVGNHKIIIKAFIAGKPETASPGKTIFFSTYRLDAPYDLSYTLKTGYLDFINFKWESDLEDDDRLKYRVYLNNSQAGETNNTNIDIDNLNYGSNIAKVQQVFIEDEAYNSDFTELSITTNKLKAPFNLVFTRKTVNSGELSWSAREDTDGILNRHYIIYIDGNALSTTTKNNNMILTNLAQGIRSLSVSQVYEKNEDYNSNQSEAYSQNMTKLTKPTIELVENMGDVYYIDQGTEKKIYIKDANGNNVQGVMSVTVKWDTIDSTKFNGIEYSLYDNWNGEESIYTTSDKSLLLKAQPTYKGVGVHHLTVEAIYPDDTDYNSDRSEEEKYEVVGTLPKPSLLWANEAPGWNGKKIMESKITWLPVKPDSVLQADPHQIYYLIDVKGNDVQVGNFISMLQPTDLNERIGTFIPDPDPFTGANKGLITQDPSTTTDYIIRVQAIPFNDFYMGKSDAALEHYKIIRLAAPTNVQYDIQTRKLTWNAVLNANKYYVYDGSTKVAETDSPTYTFPSIEDGLHIFQVSAMKITTEEA